MTVIIRTNPGERLPDVLRQLRAHAGDHAAVRSAHGGLMVSDEVALAYLSNKQPRPAPPPAPTPPALAAVVRRAEGAAGLTRPRPDTEQQPAKRRTAARRGADRDQ